MCAFVQKVYKFCEEMTKRGHTVYHYGHEDSSVNCTEHINVIQIGAGQTTIKAVTSGTTTIASTGASAIAPKLRAQYSAASCIKVATDTWYVVGDIA